VTTQTCRDIINIIGRYIHPLKAQYFFERYCEDIGLSINDFNTSDVPNFILHIAQARDDLSVINDNRFYKLLKDLVCFSNIGDGNDIMVEKEINE
jgi:hypothetical protein